MITAYFKPLLSIKNYRHLILRMAEREINARYRGSFLGLFWSIITPIIMLAIYTFVFSYVFKARWGIDNDPYEFALQLFSGLIIFNLFSECLNRAPNLILENINYVKKVVFPLEILPWISLIAALFHTMISLCVLICFMLLLNHNIGLNSLWLPFILSPLIFLILGLSWFLASLGVFIRDLTQVLSMLLTAMMFMSPIFYPISALPENIRTYIFLNPITLIVNQVREVLIYNHPPDFISLGYYTILSLTIMCLGWFWFQKTRKGFADVL